MSRNNATDVFMTTVTEIATDTTHRAVHSDKHQILMARYLEPAAAAARGLEIK
jgi:hypothetical protein